MADVVMSCAAMVSGVCGQRPKLHCSSAILSRYDLRLEELAKLLNLCRPQGYFTGTVVSSLHSADRRHSSKTDSKW